MDNKHDKEVEHLAKIIDRVYGKPGSLISRGILIGFFSGAASIIGAAVVILLLGFLVSKLGGLPLIGEFLQNINQAITN